MIIRNFFLTLFLFFPLISFGQEEEIQNLILKSIEKRTVPGAVLMLFEKDRLVIKDAFGTKDLIEKTTIGTVYDIASLSKLITATSIMILAERGNLTLHDSLTKFFPGATSKRNIKIEDLLRHVSGFRSGLKVLPGEVFDNYVSRILRLPTSRRGETIYSDLNFILLGEIVRRVSGQDLSTFVKDNIFTPLGMTSTFYQVPRDYLGLIAPTGQEKLGIPHDPTAAHFFPIPLGHAGIFSNGPDLSSFARVFLNNRTSVQNNILSSKTIEKMVLLSQGQIRGLGWDLLSPYATAPRGEVFPAGISFGHTGYTGTSLWIDPSTSSFYVFLTNRVLIADDPQSKKEMKQLRMGIATAMGNLVSKQENTSSETIRNSSQQ